MHGVAVGQGAGEGGAVGRGRPALGVAGVADQCVDQGAVHGDRRVILEATVAREPLHPTQYGLEPAARPDGIADVQHETCDPVGVAGVLRMVDCLLREAIRLVPRGCSAVELGDHLRFALLQLGSEQLTEQMVIAIPLASAIEGDHEQVAALEAVEDARGSACADGDVAERAAEAIEDGGPDEKRHVGA